MSVPLSGECLLVSTQIWSRFGGSNLFELGPNLGEPVLAVPVWGSAWAPPQVWVQFAVPYKRSKNQTKLNFGSPNPALNIDKPLVASRFVIKALRVFTALFTYCPLHMTLPKPMFGISFQVITSQRHILLQKGMSDFESSCIQSVSCASVLLKA
jgi:hypothetical protein